MSLSWKSKRGFALVAGLAFWSLGSAAVAHTSSGEAATEQMARAQAVRLAPKGATIHLWIVRRKMLVSHHDFAAPPTGRKEANFAQEVIDQHHFYS